MPRKRTEQWWLTTNGFTGMKEYLGPRLSRRKRVLFGCATARLVWRHVTRECNRQAVENSERYADGLADREEMRRAWDRLEWEPAMYESWNIVELTGDVDYRRPSDDEVGRMLEEPLPRRFCPTVRQWADALRDIAGNPFRPVTIDPAWLAANDGIAVPLAESIYQERAFDRLPILADALEEAGAGAQLVAHLREPGPHFRGCWAVDALTGRS